LLIPPGRAGPADACLQPGHQGPHGTSGAGRSAPADAA